MMKPKTFDCIELKRSIQARHLEEYKKLSDREIGDRIQEKLANSDSPVAKWFRRISKQVSAKGTST